MKISDLEKKSAVRETIEKFFSEKIYKIVISKPEKKNSQFKKLVISKQKNGYQLEKFTDKQVFHKNVKFESLADKICELLQEDFCQLNAWEESAEYDIKISKNGKVFFAKRSSQTAPRPKFEHNRKKNYILEEGKIIDPLIDMGIFTKEGKVVSSMYDKYRQINRFIEIIDDEISKLKTKKTFNVIDFGCGKSYLTFILYYYLTEIKKMDVKIVGLDLKKDVIEKCNLAAKKYRYEGLSFELGDINGYKCGFAVDMVVTLHACDTATDFALFNAVNWGANLIFSVPCCQHEVNSQMKAENLSILTKYGIIKERAAALITDAVRANMLEYCGYKTQLLEFVDFEHTPKNILIRAKKSNLSAAAKQKALAEVEAINAEFSLKPTLYELVLKK